MNNNVRKITEGAMMLAIVAVFFIVNRYYAGVFDYFLNFIIPYALIIYSARNTWKSSFALAFSILFLSLLFGTFVTFFFTSVAIVCGLVYSYGLQKGYNNTFLLLTTMFITTLSTIVSTLLLASLFGIDVIAEIKMLETILNSKSPVVIPANIVRIGYLSSVIISGIIEGIAVHLLANVILKRLKIKVNPITPINKLKLPLWFAYLSFLGPVFIVVNESIALPKPMHDMAMIIAIILFLILYVFGIIFLICYCMVKYKKNLTFIIIAVAFLTSGISTVPIVILGFLYQTTPFLKSMVGSD